MVPRAPKSFLGSWRWGALLSALLNKLWFGGTFLVDNKNGEPGESKEFLVYLTLISCSAFMK